MISLNGHNILFALKENTIHRRSKSEDPIMESNPHRLDFSLTTLIDITDKRKQFLTYTQKTARGKFERLCLARLIQGDQTITTRHAKTLNKTNNL
jgi:hypothetical protein